MKSKKRRCLEALYNTGAITQASASCTPSELLTEGKLHKASFLSNAELERLRRASWQLDDGHWLKHDIPGEETLRSYLMSLAFAALGLDASSPARLFAMPRDVCAHELGLICKKADTWLVAPKDDGVRVLLVFLKGKCFFIKRDKPYVEDVEQDAPFDESDAKTLFFLLDAELVKNAATNAQVLRVSDLLAHNQRSFSELPFARRLQLRELLLASVGSISKCPALRKLVCKQFFELEGAADKLSALQPKNGRWYYAQGDCRVPVDGLIFARAGDPYRGGVQHGLCKWKFSPTVDLGLGCVAGPRAAFFAGAPVPAPRVPLQLHYELYFDRALTSTAAGALLREYWSLWSAHAPHQEPASAEESFCAPKSEAPLVFPRSAALPGAWGECKYNRAKGAWVPSSFVLAGLPLNKHTAESPRWPVRWLRTPGVSGGAAAGPPIVATPQQVVEELMRQRAGLPPRKLFLRLTGCQDQRDVTHVGLAYSVPCAELAPVGTERASANLALLNAAVAPHASQGVWEIQLTEQGTAQLLARRQKDRPNFHTTAMQALRASAAGTKLQEVLAMMTRPPAEKLTDAGEANGQDRTINNK